MRWLYLFALLVFKVESQLLDYRSFCNTNEDCKTGCCHEKKCEILNDCKIFEQYAEYISQTYCDINAECSSKCCLYGHC